LVAVVVACGYVLGQEVLALASVDHGGLVRGSSGAGGVEAVQARWPLLMVHYDIRRGHRDVLLIAQWNL